VITSTSDRWTGRYFLPMTTGVSKVASWAPAATNHKSVTVEFECLERSYWILRCSISCENAIIYRFKIRAVSNFHIYVYKGTFIRVHIVLVCVFGIPVYLLILIYSCSYDLQ